MNKICVVTGSRAEYGLLKPLLKRMCEDDEIELQLFVTGSHLSEEFGLTYREIERDGFRITKKIEIALADDSPMGISRSMALALTGITSALQEVRPNLVVLLGDRYEIFMAATASTLTNRNIAHIHGGESTEGSYDDAFRHSITKMSHLHFTSTEEYRKRVIQLGENPDKVYCVGSLGVESINSLKLMSKDELVEEMGFPIDDRTLLVTFHPATLEEDNSERQFLELIEALNDIEDCKLIFTKSNADVGGKSINRIIDQYVKGHPNSIAFQSLGQLRYLSLMKYCGAIVGNSSSGIIEAPSMRIPTINIGDRQKGRVQTTSIINCKPLREEIKRAINLGLSQEFILGLAQTRNPYEGETPSISILNEIKNYLNKPGSIKKKFYDV